MTRADIMIRLRAQLLKQLWMATVVMVTVSEVRPSLSSTSQSCGTPISIYSGGKLQRKHGEKVTEEHCPKKMTPDSQWIQSIPKLIRRSAAVHSCSSRSTFVDNSGLFVCRSPDCLAKPCQNQGQCEETIDSFACLCPSEFTGITCDTAVGIISNLTTLMEADSSITANTITMEMENASGISSTANGSYDIKTCPTDWDAFGSKCYKFNALMLSWQVHFNHCENVFNATMLVVESKEEDDFIASMYTAHSPLMWMGCWSPAGTKNWSCPSSGATWPEPIGYWNWDRGEPNRAPKSDNCLILYFDGFRDRSCSWKLKSVCQK